MNEHVMRLLGMVLSKRLDDLMEGDAAYPEIIGEIVEDVAAIWALSHSSSESETYVKPSSPTMGE